MTTIDIKNILVPTDFSETATLALEHGVYLARITKATLYVLHVIKVSDLLYENHTNATAIENYAHEHLATIANNYIAKYAIKVIPICTKGNPASEITKLVTEKSIDIVLMGTHGASGFNEYFIGSNANKTIRKCSCPVLTIQTNTNKLGFSNIALPVNNSYHSLEKVNRTIDIAKLFSAKIHVLGLLDSDEEIAAKKFNIKLENIEKIITHEGVLFTRSINRTENFALDTLNYSEQNNIDLIVVMSNDESELNESFMGLFSKQIVNHSKIPVLSILQKPAIYSSNRPT